MAFDWLKSFDVSWLKPSNRSLIVLAICFAIVAIVAIVVGTAVGLQSKDVVTLEKLFKTAPLIDGHNLLPRKISLIANNQLNEVNIQENNRTQTDIRRMRKSGLRALFLSVSVDCRSQYRDAVRACLDQVDTVKRIVRKHQDDLILVDSADGLRDAVKDGKIAVALALEAGHCIDSSLAVLRIFYELGVRYMTLTQNCNTPWAESWVSQSNKSAGNLTKNSELENKGLSKFGEAVIAEMNRLGMIVDLSHASIEAVRRTLGVSIAPVIFSHSGVFSVCRHPRNVPDDLLIQLKRHQGLLLITFFNDLISCSPEANVTDVADHFDYVRNLIGADYVGIGSDFDGVPRTPKGLSDVSEYGALFQSLRDRGWKDEELEKVAGKNILRVLQDVEQVRLNYPEKFSRPNEALIPESDLVDTSCRVTSQ